MFSIYLNYLNVNDTSINNFEINKINIDNNNNDYNKLINFDDSFNDIDEKKLVVVIIKMKLIIF